MRDHEFYLIFSSELIINLFNHTYILHTHIHTHYHRTIKSSKNSKYVHLLNEFLIGKNKNLMHSHSLSLSVCLFTGSQATIFS
jgi:hypothetical protein